MPLEEKPIPRAGGPQIWNAVRGELLEIAWLALAVSAMSAAGVGLAVLLAGA
jgi:hypothetical protein